MEISELISKATQTVSPISSEAEDVIEEKWCATNERWFLAIKEECLEKAASHEKKGLIYKKINSSFQIPLISIPIVMSVLTTSVALAGITPYLMLGIGLLNALSQYFAFGVKAQKHFEFSNRYSDLASDIGAELIHRKKFRQSFDVFITKVRMSLKQLDNDAPLI